jgi:hypothetical protein
VGQYEAGRTNSTHVDNWASLTNILSLYLATSCAALQSTLGESASTSSYTWNGSQNSVWVNALNWTPNGVPTSISMVIIPDAATTLYSPTLPASIEIKALTIETAGVLNAAANEQFTINGDNGAWSNSGGTYNAANSHVIFTNISATISGITDFYDITIYSGAGLFMTGGSLMGIGGTMTNDGTWNTIDGGLTTVEYNGTSAQTMGFASATTFNNLTIDNAIGVTLTSNALTTIEGMLTINEGKLFEIAPGKRLAVTGMLTNVAGASGFVLRSNATGTASLIHNTDDVPATVECYMGGAAEAWHFISSPVSDQEISGSWLPSGTYGNGTGYDLYVWNESTNCWIYNLDITSPVNWNTVHPGTDFETVRGYLYAVQVSNPTKEFAGILNNGPLGFGLTFNSNVANLKGFNLVGNPYPSAIDWASGSGWNRNSLLNTGGGYDMWIWNPAANNYGVYNSSDPDGTGTNSVTRYIAPMQGYFVRAALNGNLGMDNEVRYSNGTGYLLKSSKQHFGNLSIGVESDAGYGSDEIQLIFGCKENENGAIKLFSNVLSAPSLYISSYEEPLSMFYLTNTDENPVVPMNFTPGINGKYTLSCNFDPMMFDTLLLEDLQTHNIQNMKAEKSYSFYASKTDQTNRFVLHFGPVSEVKDNKLPARIYYNGDNLVVDLEKITLETDVYVYDVLGHLLLQEKLQGETMHYLTIAANSQLLIVYLKNPDGMYCEKIIINDY